MKIHSHPPRILVIGCASRDTVHLEPQLQTIRSVGGAGYYTALAAEAVGASVTLLAPKLSDNIGSGARSTQIDQYEFYEKLDWIGPLTAQDQFPSLEIRHHGNDRATLCAANWGSEHLLNPDLLPGDLSDFSIVHIAALSSAARQLAFFKAIRSVSQCRISVGTYGRLAYNETAEVRRLVQDCDFVFMNSNEAAAVFDSEAFPLNPRCEQMTCITKGKDGAVVCTTESRFDLSGLPVLEYDPTGAGDTFAGTMLAGIALGWSLEKCAQLAVQRSALVITQPGPQAILSLLV